MYGGLWCFPAGEFQYPHYLQARDRPSPLSDQFNRAYWDTIVLSPGVERLSIKALLATRQRIPGLGNGVLQDILFNARIHPKKATGALTAEQSSALYCSVKSTLAEMAFQGGRDTERDLFGRPGGYQTKLSKNTVNSPGPACGTTIQKEAYMGGSTYYCAGCQELDGSCSCSSSR